MSVVSIIQARMGSSRFPGKMAARLGDSTLMEWVLRRASRSMLADVTVLATSDHPRDKVLQEIAVGCGVPVICGSEEDVLGRYALAAREFHAETVVRICGDRPLVDPQIVDMAIAEYRRGGADLTFNHISDGSENWPRGFGAEVLSADLLYRLSDGVTDPYHREHVTSAVWADRKFHSVRPAKCPPALDPGFADLRFDVDTVDDLGALRSLMPLPQIDITADHVVSLWKTRQD